jgi:hypothetical protein
MTGTTWMTTGAAMLMAILGWGYAASAQPSTTNLPIDQTTSYKGEEFLLIGDANRGGGEPVIAIDPTNPDNIIVGAMANLHYVKGQTLDMSPKGFDPDSLMKYRNSPGTSISEYAISNDRGRTWRFIEDPFRDRFKMNGTADAFVGAGTDGTLFIGSMNFFPMNPTPKMIADEKDPNGFLYGSAAIAWSSDHGKTWSTPKIVMGQFTPPEEYGPGVKPHLIGSTPYDRPSLSTDESTGTIYVPGNGTSPHRETFLRASKDNGKTWGLIHAYDSEDYPQGGEGSRPAAAHGVLGVAYVASSVPPNSGGKCPCIVFGVSRDDGKTFDRHVVKYDFVAPSFFDGMGNPTVAADPSHPGRFAVMTTTAGNSEMQVYVTDDYGVTWKVPVTAGRVSGATIRKPSMAYSPHGDLAVMWLALFQDQTYSAWSAASHDGGGAFSAPIQVSHAPSPPRSAIKKRGNNWDGDDLSSIAVDRDFVHIVWADGRAGFLGAWYARIPLTSY